MAKISIDVDTNFAEASVEMKKFGGVLSTESEKYKELIKKYDDKAIDTLIEKNRRLASSIAATNGPQKASIAQQKALAKEIKKLVSEGLDPNGDELKSLREEYQRVTVQVNDHIRANDRLKESQKQSAKDARKALRAIEDSEKKLQKTQKDRAEAQKRNAQIIKNSYLVIGAAAAGAIAKTIQSASQIEDIAASFEPLAGGAERATELVQKLNETAATTPFQIEGIAKAAQVLLPAMNGDLDLTVERFRMIGDTAGGNAEKMTRIASVYSRALLKNKVEMGDINQLAEKGIPIYSELSESMGITVEQLTKMASRGEITGDDLTKAFQKMTSEGGIFYRGMDIASKTFSGKMSTMKDNVNLLAANLGSQLLPMASQTADMITEFVQSFDDEQVDQFGESVKFVFKGILTAGASFGAGLNVIFTAVDARISQSVTASFAVLESLTTLAVKSGEFNEKIYARLNIKNEPLEKQMKTLRELKTLMKGAREASSVATGETIEAGLKRNEILSGYIENLDKAFQKEGALGSPGGDVTHQPPGGDTPPRQIEGYATIVDTVDNSEIFAKELDRVDFMRSQMRLVTDEEKKNQDLRKQMLLDFYDSSLELEGVKGEERYVFLEEQLAMIKDLETITMEEKVAAQEALNEKMKYLREEDLSDDRENAQARLAIAGDLAGGLSNLITAVANTRRGASREQRAMLVAAKGLAIAEIAIDTGVGIAKALRDPTVPSTALRIAQAGVVGINGLAAGIKVTNTPIPTAETGADFIVPDNGIGRTSRVDNVAVNAQPGERVSVTPRGESSIRDRSIVVNVYNDSELLYSQMQEGLDSGQVRISQENVA